MSIQYLNKALTTDLVASAKMVLVALSNFADERGVCFPSLRTLAKTSGVKKTNLCYILKTFMKCGILNRTRRKRENGSDTSTLYTIESYNIDAVLYKRVYRAIRNYAAINNDDTLMTKTNTKFEQKKETKPEKFEPFEALDPFIKKALASQEAWEVFVLEFYDHLRPKNKKSIQIKLWWGETVRKNILKLEERTLKNVKNYYDHLEQVKFRNEIDSQEVG